MLSSTNVSDDELNASFNGQQIANLLRTDGPIVSCVLLHSTAVAVSNSAPTKGGEDREPLQRQETDVGYIVEKEKVTGEMSSSNILNDSETLTKAIRASYDHNNDGGMDEMGNDTPKTKNRIILKDQISQIMVDTTPKKSMVAQILGGPFTFLGQYEEEGIVAMVRREPENKYESEIEDKTNGNENQELSINPHQLQPPLHNAKVYGDILLMKVAPCDDEDDNNVEPRDRKGDKEKEVESPISESGSKPNSTPQKLYPSTSSDGESKSTPTATKEDRQQNQAEAEAEPKATKLLSNEEFFLNYTKEEYIKFASRTDIVPSPEKEKEEERKLEEMVDGGDKKEEGVDKDDNDDDDDEGDGEEDDGEEDDVDFDTNWGSDEEDFDEEDEDCQISMMNIILAQIIKRFREENGRGPNTEELLAMKSALVEKLGIEDLINDAGDNNNDEDEDEDEDVNLSSTLENDDNGNETMGGNANEIETTTTTEVALPAADGGNEKSCSTSQPKVNKRKTDVHGVGGREKRVKFTNKNQVKLIPGIQLKENSDDDDDDDEEEEEDFEDEVDGKAEDMTTHYDIELEEGEGEI